MLEHAPSTFAFFDENSIELNGEIVPTFHHDGVAIDRFARLIPSIDLPHHLVSHRAIVVYGGVNYPMPGSVDTYGIPSRSTLIIRAPHGSLIPAPSREVLDDAAVNTDVLTKLVKMAMPRIRPMLQAAGDQCESARAAFSMLRRYDNIPESFAWRSRTYQIDSFANGWVLTWDKKAKEGRAHPHPDSHIHCVLADPNKTISRDGARAFMVHHHIDQFVIVGQPVGQRSWLTWGQDEEGVTVHSYDDLVRDAAAQRKIEREGKPARKAATYDVRIGSDEGLVELSHLNEAQVHDAITEHIITAVWLTTSHHEAGFMVNRHPGTMAIVVAQSQITKALLARWNKKMARHGITVGDIYDQRNYVRRHLVENASPDLIHDVLSNRLLASDFPVAVLRFVTSARVHELLTPPDDNRSKQISELRVAMSYVKSSHTQPVPDRYDVVPGLRTLVTSHMAKADPELTGRLIDLLDKDTA